MIMTTERTKELIAGLTDDALGESISDSWVILCEWHGSNDEYNHEVNLYNSLMTEAEARGLR